MMRNKRTEEMIKRFKTYCLITLSLMATLYRAQAQHAGPAVTVKGVEPVVTVKKTVSQRLALSAKATLVLYDYYGNVKINTSKSKYILVKAVISASSKDAAKANDLLQSVHIDFEKKPDTVTCVAAIGAPVMVRAMNVPDTGKKQPPVTITILPAKWCSVNLEVYLPAAQPLAIHSMFGNITMGDYGGNLNIDEQFGDLAAGNLSGYVRLAMQQGNLNVKHINFGQLDVKTFDHVNIAGISGELKSQFQFGRELNLNLKYLSRNDSIGLKANNVQQVNVSGVTPVAARYTLKLGFSKLQLNGAAFTSDKNIFSITEINVDKRKREAEHLDDSILQAHPELKFVPADVTLSADTLKSKKIKELKILSLAKFKKVHEYVAGPEDAKKKVNITVDFGTLNLTQ